MEACINYLFLPPLWHATRRPCGYNCYPLAQHLSLVPSSKIFDRIVEGSCKCGIVHWSRNPEDDAGKEEANYRSPWFWKKCLQKSSYGEWRYDRSCGHSEIEGIQTRGAPWDTDPLNHWLVISFAHLPYKLKDTTCDELPPQKLDRKWRLRLSGWLWTYYNNSDLLWKHY